MVTQLQSSRKARCKTVGSLLHKFTIMAEIAESLGIKGVALLICLLSDVLFGVFRNISAVQK